MPLNKTPIIGLQPLINAGQPGRDKPWRQVWGDEFLGSTISARWRPETMADTPTNTSNKGQHQTGAKGVKADGTLDPDWYYKSGTDANGVDIRDPNKGTIISPNHYYADGKRWACWYNAHRDYCQYVSNGKLVMRPYVSDEDDPTVAGPYQDDGEGKIVDPRKKIYLPWLDTNALNYRDGTQRPDPTGPRHSGIDTDILKVDLISSI